MSPPRKPKRHFGTDVVHAGQRADPTTGAVSQPVYLTSTYVQPGSGRDRQYTYARAVNPTRSALERNLAALEGGVEARCFASGMAAIAAVLSVLDSGDHVVVAESVYGGTYRLFEGLLRRQGLRFSWVDPKSPRAIEAAIEPRTKMLYIETPSNPTLELTDIAASARIARRNRIRLVADNTFMSPCLQQPLALGADFVVHSTTKYLNGHSDSIGGAVISRRRPDAEKIAWVQNAAGAILSPMDSFLILRGVKTLALRMERHDSNARTIAAWLDARRKVERVYYPGLRSHPQHALAGKQMRGFGGMVTIDLGSLARARRFLGSLRLFTPAESLGGVESLAAHPATMTHGSLPASERRRIGVTDGLVRLSVGIEAAEDLIADLAQALRRL